MVNCNICEESFAITDTHYCDLEKLVVDTVKLRNLMAVHGNTWISTKEVIKIVMKASTLKWKVEPSQNQSLTTKDE